MIPVWASEYVGIPFVDAGRTRAGCDCWGLVRLVLAERFGIDLPSWDGYERVQHDTAEPLILAACSTLASVNRVCDPVPGDICLMRIRGRLSHVGIYLGDGCLLHTDRRINSVIQRADCFRLAPRIEGWYRVSPDQVPAPVHLGTADIGA